MESKKSSQRSKFVAVALIALMFSGGCSEISRMDSDPPGGKISINGTFIGEAPQTYRYRSGLPDTYIVEVKKEGYKTLSNVTIDRALRADISLVLLIAGIVPYFFSARLEDQYIFRMEKETSPAAAAPAAAPPAAPLDVEIDR